MSVTIRLKRGLSSDWTSQNIVLENGEPGVETDTLRFKIGDGVTPWTQLAYVAGDAAGEYATLVDGKVPSSQLPSYVDDVLEYLALSSFPANGESGKIYVAMDSNKIYRWEGSSYIPVSAPSTTVVTLAFNSVLQTNAASGDIFDVTLTNNTTLANPTNPVNGKTLRWRISQDSAGNRGVTLGNKFNLPSSATSPLPWSTAGNKMDVLAATYHAGRDKWDIVAFVPGY